MQKTPRATKRSKIQAPIAKAKNKAAKASGKAKGTVTSRAAAKTAPKKRPTVTKKAIAKSRPAAKTASKKRAPAARKGVAKSRPDAKVSKAGAAPKLGARSRGAPTRKATPKGASAKVPRRDATGHLNPQYARDLRALSQENRDGRSGNDRAFFTTSRSGDDLAEELGEEAVATMTTGEDQSERLLDKEVDEERGGPFVKTRGQDEFARGTDRSNPRGSTREPFPRT